VCRTYGERLAGTASANPDEVGYVNQYGLSRKVRSRSSRMLQL
jgi:hypothetical protein